MPNWCENDLTISGASEALDRFITVGLDFNTAIPYPEEYAALDRATRAWEAEHPYGSDAYKAHWQERPKDGYNHGGYEWCVKHWGCKWPAAEDTMIDRLTPTKAKSSFETPWSPPLPVIEKWSELYPDLTFTLKFYERGMGFK